MELAAREPEPPTSAQARASGHLHGPTQLGPAHLNGPGPSGPGPATDAPKNTTPLRHPAPPHLITGPATHGPDSNLSLPARAPGDLRVGAPLRAIPSGTQVRPQARRAPTHCCIRQPPRKAKRACGHWDLSPDSESGPLQHGRPLQHPYHQFGPQLLSLAYPGPGRTSGHIAIATCQPAGRHRAHQGYYEIESRAQLSAPALRGLPIRPRLPSLINCRSPTHTTQVRPLPTDREHRLRRGRTKTELAGQCGPGHRHMPVPGDPLLSM